MAITDPTRTIALPLTRIDRKLPSHTEGIATLVPAEGGCLDAKLKTGEVLKPFPHFSFL